MAVQPAIRYPANSIPGDSAYPFGSAKNSSAPGAKNGYPWEKDQINDWQAYFQGLLSRGDISPSDVVDTVLISDYLNGLDIAIGKKAGVTHKTIAAVIADPSIKAGQTIRTQDNKAGIRGGSADYLVKTTAEKDADSDPINETGNHTSVGVPGLFVILQPRFDTADCRQFGCDGSADTAAFQDAVNQMANKTLYINVDLELDITSEIAVTSKIVIKGRGKIKPDAIRALNVTASKTILKQFTIEHDILDTSTAFTSILLNAVDDCEVSGVTVTDSFKTTECIKIKNGNRNKVKNNRLLRSRGAGVLIEGTLLDRGTDNQVVHNFIDETGYHGIYTRKNASTLNTNNLISGNIIKGVGLHTSVSLSVGIEAWGYGDIVTGNNVQGVLEIDTPKEQSFIGITIGTNPYSIVSNNRVNYFREIGIEVGNISNNCIVSSNVILNIYDDFTTPTKGSGLAYTGTSDSKNVQFNNNNVSRVFLGYSAPFGLSAQISCNTFISDLFDKASHLTRGLNILNATTFTNITGNTFEGWDIGILPAESSMSNDAVNISGNMFRDCNWGIRTLLKPANISGNHFFDCGSSPDSAAIGLESGENWNVSGNTFQHSVAGSIAVVVKNESTDHGGMLSANKMMDNMQLTGAITSWAAINVKDDQLLNGPSVTYGAAIPGSGTFKLGDIIYNTNPTPGGTVGWVNTTAGTPGTWKTFGSIAA